MSLDIRSDIRCDIRRDIKRDKSSLTKSIVMLE